MSLYSFHSGNENANLCMPIATASAATITPNSLRQSKNSSLFIFSIHLIKMATHTMGSVKRSISDLKRNAVRISQKAMPKFLSTSFSCVRIRNAAVADKRPHVNVY